MVPQGGVGGINGFELQAQAEHADIFLIFTQNIDSGYMLGPPYLGTTKS